VQVEARKSSKLRSGGRPESGGRQTGSRGQTNWRQKRGGRPKNGGRPEGSRGKKYWTPKMVWEAGGQVEARKISGQKEVGGWWAGKG